MRIILAEDDQFLAEGLALVLRDSGYAVNIVSTGLEADQALAADYYDLLILDLGLPSLDGTEVLKRLRQRGQKLPVLIVTAREGLQNMVNGLDLGANDYMIKPFQIPELQARVRALLRKEVWSNRTEITIGSLVFNTATKMAYIGGENIELTSRELEVLTLLLRYQDVPMSKERIANLLSDWANEVSFNALSIVVHRLRKKLEPAQLTIRALRGLGYRIEKIQ